jgi:hypothetical protein
MVGRLKGNRLGFPFLFSVASKPIKENGENFAGSAYNP